MNKTILIPAGDVQNSLAIRVGRLTFNALGNQSLARYFDLLRFQFRRIRREFTEPELQAILDGCNGTNWDPIPVGVQSVSTEVAEAVEFNGLAEKWKIDGAKLVSKLNALDGLGCLAVIEFTEFAWNTCERLDFCRPYAILGELADGSR
ncbi:MAG: hypothetical protein E6Q97_24080 [Desulfurellales bacterium]|nr:MAG: hypothetical protein E6Q97_24080 [Desulfurellales bacterium]